MIIHLRVEDAIEFLSNLAELVKFNINVSFAQIFVTSASSIALTRDEKVNTIARTINGFMVKDF